MWQRTEDDGYDGVQYDTEYDPSPGQLEAAELRQAAAEELAAEFGNDVSEWLV